MYLDRHCEVLPCVSLIGWTTYFRSNSLPICLFPHCVASKNPRVGWTHSFVFLMHRNLRIKSFARTFHEIICLYLMFFYSFQSWNQMTPTPDYHNPSLTKLALESCFLKRNRKGRTNLIEFFFFWQTTSLVFSGFMKKMYLLFPTWHKDKRSTFRE